MKREPTKYDVVSIARIAHEANRAYCRALGDATRAAWEDAPDWQRDSAMSGVEAVLRGTLSPEQCHEDWLEEKRTAGWVYGEAKDADAKTHPCMVPYADLPAAERAKDELFVAVVSATARGLGVL